MPRVRLPGFHRRRRRSEWGEYEPYDELNGSDDEGLPIEPFVPVESQRYDAYAYGDTDDYSDALDDNEPLPRYRRLRAPRVHLPRPRLSVPRPHLPSLAAGPMIRFDVLLVMLVLITAGLMGTLYNLDRLPSNIETWWPLAVMVGAGLWMLAALARRQVASFLGATAALGAGLSFLLDAQDIADFEATLLGIVLVTIGLGIVLRGLLLRQQTPA